MDPVLPLELVVHILIYLNPLQIIKIFEVVKYEHNEWLLRFYYSLKYNDRIDLNENPFLKLILKEKNFYRYIKFRIDNNFLNNNRLHHQISPDDVCFLDIPNPLIPVRMMHFIYKKNTTGIYSKIWYRPNSDQFCIELEGLFKHFYESRGKFPFIIFINSSHINHLEKYTYNMFKTLRDVINKNRNNDLYPSFKYVFCTTENVPSGILTRGRTGLPRAAFGLYKRYLFEERKFIAYLNLINIS